MESEKISYAKHFIKTVLEANNIDTKGGKSHKRKLEPLECQIAHFLLYARLCDEGPLTQKLHFNNQDHLAERFTEVTGRTPVPRDSTISRTLSKLENLGLISNKRDSKKNGRTGKEWVRITFEFNNAL
jgi:hypothetical protein